MPDPTEFGHSDEKPPTCELAWNLPDDCADEAKYVIFGSRRYDICERHAKNLNMKGYVIYTPTGGRFRG